MKSLAYKTQVIFFWLLVLVITFVIYTAKQKFLGKPLDPIFTQQEEQSDDLNFNNNNNATEKLPIMLNSTHMYNSVKHGVGRILNSTLGILPE